MASASLRLAIGTLYLGGALFLLPGFLWIIPTRVVSETFPIHFDNVTHRPDAFKTISFPVFCNATAHSDTAFIMGSLCNSEYANGVNILIVGMSLILVASILDLAFVQCRTIACNRQHNDRQHLTNTVVRPLDEPILPVATTAAAPTAACMIVQLLSPICQLLGAATILAGCIVFLPQYSLPPTTIWGLKAPDLGNDLFQASAVLYFVGAVLSICETAVAIRRAKSAGRPTAKQWVTIVAFCLFICTSSLFFANAQLPKDRAVEAGQYRLAAAVCLLCAVVLFFGLTLADVRALEASK